MSEGSDLVADKRAWSVALLAGAVSGFQQRTAVVRAVRGRAAGFCRGTGSVDGLVKQPQEPAWSRAVGRG